MKIMSCLPGVLAFGSILAASVPASAADAVKFSGMRAHTFIQLVNEFYVVPRSDGTPTSGQYDRITKVDSIRCEWDKAASALARCSLKVKGQELARRLDTAWSPDATIFQLLRETGGAWVDAQQPSVVVTAGADVSCDAYEHGPSYYNCMYSPVSEGKAPAPQEFFATVKGVRAAAALAALADSGLENTAGRQFAKKFAVDGVKCTATLIDYQNHSDLNCLATVGGKELKLSRVVGIYRLLAESGAAKYDAASNAYVATAAALTCYNDNTHEDQPSACTFTVADRQQVVGWVASEYVGPQEGESFLKALKSLGAVRPIWAAEGIVGLDAFTCLNPSVTSDQVSALTCTVGVSGSSMPAADRAANAALVKFIVDDRGDLLDPLTLSETVNQGMRLFCEVHNTTASYCEFKYITAALL